MGTWYCIWVRNVILLRVKMYKCQNHASRRLIFLHVVQTMWIGYDHLMWLTLNTNEGNSGCNFAADSILSNSISFSVMSHPAEWQSRPVSFQTGTPTVLLCIYFSSWKKTGQINKKKPTRKSPATRLFVQVDHRFLSKLTDIIGKTYLVSEMTNAWITMCIIKENSRRGHAF